MSGKEPLKVTVTFASPVAHHNDYPVHLDALVAWCVADQAEEDGDGDAWEIAEDLAHVFDRVEAPGGQWVWTASQVIFTPASEVLLQNQIRRLDPLDFLEAKDSNGVENGGVLDMRQSTISRGSGQFRAYQFPISFQWMKKAEAWCVADWTELEALLGRLRGIGKLTRNGFGRIADLTITSDGEATDRWRDRVLPLGVEGMSGRNYVPMRSCLHPPYWRKTAQVDAQEPLR